MTRARFYVSLACALGLASGCAPDDRDLGDCPSDAEFFEADVWLPLASMTCYACHNAEGAAKDSRMVLLAPDEDGAVSQNMATMAAMAQERVDGSSLLLLKPSGTHPEGHGGGMVLAADSDAYAALAEFVARVDGTFECDPDGIADSGDGDGPSCDALGVGPRVIRRLSHDEYDSTIRDLLAVEGGLAEQGASFAPDNVINGFTKNASVLTVSGLLADQYRAAAEALADHVVANPDRYLGCDPSAGEVCVDSFVRTFGARAFRRPVSDEEAARYVALFAALEPEDGFDEALRWVVAAMLQSPNFLYRTELGVPDGDGAYALTPHEVAAELSYLVIGTMPDAELAALAESGEILDADVLEAQAARLLADARSEQTLARFVDEWLVIGLLPFVTRDPDLYPEFTPAIRAAMLGEIHRLVYEVFYTSGSLDELLTADFTYVTDELAAYYGIAGADQTDAAGFGRISLDGARYGGLLTQGAINAAHAKPTTSSPIHRGVLVRERLMCQELPPPPPALDTSPPPVDPSLSTRERYLQHSSEPACKGCHELIDGIGFGLEHYDAIGRFRELDGVHTVDASGEIVRSEAIDGAFDGVGELQTILAGAEEVQACYAQMWAEYSLGGELDGELACVGDDLREQFIASGGQLNILVRDLVRSRHFVTRGGEGGSGDPGDGGEDTAGEDTSTDGGEDNGDTDDTGDTDGGEDTGPGASEGLEIEVVNDTMWAQGECNTVYVYNVTDAAITWEVTLVLPGTLNNYWNAQVELQGDEATFVGESHNSTVEAQGTVSFGFCVEY